MVNSSWSIVSDKQSMVKNVESNSIEIPIRKFHGMPGYLYSVENILLYKGVPPSATVYTTVILVDQRQQPR